MKKKLLIIAMFSTLLLTGCNKTETDKKETLKDWYLSQELANEADIHKIICPELDDNSITLGSSGYFVSNNKVYKYIYKKLYSNETNCKLVGEINDNIILMYGQDYYSYDGNKYKYNEDDESIEKFNFKYEYFEKFDVNKELVSIRPLYGDNFFYDLITYVNNELKAYYIDYNNSNNPEYITYDIDTSAIGDEEIIKLYGPIIKTNKAYYQVKQITTNKEQCKKYDDVKCEYEYKLKKNIILTNHYDEIMNFSNEYVITKNLEFIPVYSIIK